MRIVVDTNIIFSAILNTNNKIGQILLQPKSKLNFYATEQLRAEIKEHKAKIRKISGLSESELDRVIELITKNIRFINVKLISKESYQFAEQLTHDVDIDDTEFVALTEHLKAKLWSGDKELQKGLNKKNWNKFISTEELIERTTRRKK
ncbi:MAG TPA: PIN domain-containing protein [Salinivirgaceae bacterium]|nr:PIN domain-containing protein [Salinivirgaceae bacterium]